jgi:thioesterase domain-containing protein/aryl carrier-like protein
MEDSFFLAGGHSLLGMQLVMRVRTAFGVDVTLRELFKAPTVERLALLIETKIEKQRLAANPTVRQQVAQAPTKANDTPSLPDGVFALRPYGTRPGIFWVHNYPSLDLAKVIGDDQPFFSVLLTSDDFSSLGKSPDLQSFATCLLRKIQAVQSEGPYVIGGFCLGGLLAHEIVSQLRAGGHEVSLLVIVDAPNPARIEPSDALMDKISYLGYILKRSGHLGPRQSLIYLREHLLKLFGRAAKATSANTEMGVALQAAALAYRPVQYDGNVLLILASEHPPHANFLSGWREVFPGNLHTKYVGWHHRDLSKSKSVPSVADAIVSYLACPTDETQSPLCADGAGSTALLQTTDPIDVDRMKKARWI